MFNLRLLKNCNTFKHKFFNFFKPSPYCTSISISIIVHTHKSTQQTPCNWIYKTVQNIVQDSYFTYHKPLPFKTHKFQNCAQTTTLQSFPQFKTCKTVHKPLDHIHTTLQPVTASATINIFFPCKLLYHCLLQTQTAEPHFFCRVNWIKTIVQSS